MRDLWDSTKAGFLTGPGLDLIVGTIVAGDVRDFKISLFKC